MSCGLTPALYRQFTEQKQTPNPANSTTNASWDWTSTYNRWSNWEDPDEVAKRQADEQKKQESLAKRQQIGGCNHDHSAEREVYDKPTLQKLDECQMFAREGNGWFQEGQHFRAGERFRKVLVWLDYTFPDTDEEQQRMDELMVSAHVNLAVCKLKTGQLDEVLENTFQALKMDPNNVKAMYCRGKVFRLRHNFEEAKKEFLGALKIEPNNVETRKQLAFLKHEIKRYKLDMGNRAKAMFNNNKTATNPANMHDEQTTTTAPRLDYLKPFRHPNTDSYESDEDVEDFESDDDTAAEPVETHDEFIDEQLPDLGDLLQLLQTG